MNVLTALSKCVYQRVNMNSLSRMTLFRNVDQVPIRRVYLYKLQMEGIQRFEIDTDVFHCISLVTKRVQFSSEEDFKEKFENSMEHWQESGIRCVTVKVQLEHSSLVPIVVQNGFVYHHAQPTYVLLKKWICKTEKDNYPHYANQYLGCAGFVVNSQNQLLVIREKHHSVPHWKFPGGLADTGEDVADAAIREVREETGVETQFDSILCFRHQHNFRFGCGDFYYICLLRPLSLEINKCDQEIAEAKWMDLDEYMKLPSVTDLNRFIAQTYIDLRNSQYSLNKNNVFNYKRTHYNSVYAVQLNNSSGSSTKCNQSESGPR